MNDEQYRAWRQFLGHFTGKSREAKQGHIYSLNYDLLLYWTLMHTRFMEPDPANPSVMRPVATEEIDHNDGFLAPENEPDAEYVTWDGEVAHQQSVFYLHGALHLFDYG